MPNRVKLITYVMLVNLICNCKSHIENTYYESDCVANLITLCDILIVNSVMILLLLIFVHIFKR